MVEFLTDIFDSDDNFEHNTRGSSNVRIEFPYLTLFAGAVPEWIANNFDSTFVDEGFASRTIFINEHTVRFRNPRPEITKDMWRTRDKMVRDLGRITECKGEYEWTDEAGEWFDDWYKVDYDNEELDRKLAGYKSRKPLHMIKVAMLLALNEGDELTITLPHLTEAKKQLELIQPKMVEAFSAVGRNPYASNMERIEAEIRAAGGMSIGEIVDKTYSDTPNKQIREEMLENLCMMKKIREERVSSELWYFPL